MQRVLLDGTTAVMVARLIDGTHAPSALNIYSLSLLIESLILHDELLVLDTTRGAQLVGDACRGYGEAVRVERRSVREIIDHYVEMEHPPLVGLQQLREDELIQLKFGGDLRSRIVRAAGDDVQQVLERHYANDDCMLGYLDLLDQFHSNEVARARAAEKESAERGRSRTEKFLRRRFPLIASLKYGYFLTGLSSLFDSGPAPASDGTASGKLAGDSDICLAWPMFLERYTGLAQNSFWQEGARERQVERYTFTTSLLIRTHLYLVASEVFGAPYRPDILRAPICWKFFDKGSYADFTVAERFVDAAERINADRIKTVNDFLGRSAFATLPFFATRVLAESRNANDIIARTLEIRESQQARRFRRYLSELSMAEATGDIAKLVKAIGQYSALLTKAYGRSDGIPDIAWSLGASAGKAAVALDPANIASLIVDSAKGGVSAANLGRRWWFGRKVALITKSVRQVGRAEAMQPMLRRMFGRELSADELTFMTSVEQIISKPRSS